MCDEVIIMAVTGRKRLLVTLVAGVFCMGMLLVSPLSRMHLP